jgi:hypothetical protein
LVSGIERRVFAELGSLPPVAVQAAQADSVPRARLADIFHGRYRGRTLMLSIFNAAQVIGFYGFDSWLPTLLGPTRIRSRAVGFVYSWSRLAAAFAGLIIGALLADGGVDAVAAFIGAAMLLAMGVIAFFGPSTRGMALEQLNDKAARPGPPKVSLARGCFTVKIKHDHFLHGSRGIRPPAR